MASEKVFRELLCESRSHPVESTDPNRARAIDDLKRQLRETKAGLEGERAKVRQLQAQCERDIRRVKEDCDKKLSASLEALAMRKEQERATDIRRVEERLRKEWEAEVRAVEAKKSEEMSRAQRKWQHDKDEEIRRVVRDERELLLKDVSFEGDEPSLKEEKLTRELFQLSQQNATLEDQLYNLSRENRVQIEQLRRMKHEHELEIADIIRQHQTEASRDYAQLRLAEQILAEREQDLHIVENKAERDRMEKEQLAEEMAAMKSVLSTSVTEPVDSPQSSRRSIGGVLQRRMEDLEASLKKLEEERSSLKLENASLRKKLVQDMSSEGKTAPKEEEKTRKLRKRNAELVSLVKTLDEKCKSLKSDYEQLQKSSPSDSEQQLRKSLNRQHAKDIMDYTKQIHSKDREIGDLKRRIAKLEVNSKPPSEPAPELENKVKVMAMDRLKIEKLVSKLCSQLPEEHEVTALSRTELECEAACVEALDLENQTLKRELATLQGRTEQVDAPEGTTDLQAQVARLSKFESEALSLRQELDHTHSLNSDLEQRCHVLTQQLEVSQLAVKELQSNADHVTSLEREVEGLTREMQSHRNRANQAAQDCDRAHTELSQVRDQLNTLHNDLEDRDRLLQERETLCQQLQAKQPSTEVGVQTQPYDNSSDRRVNSDPLLTSPETSSPYVSGALRDVVRSGGVRGDLLDSSLDLEMKAAGVEITDPYDSSEGAGFSDLSTHSLESLKNDKMDSVGVVTAIPDQISAAKVEEKCDSEEDDDDTFHEQPSGPSLYIAKFSYSPAEQSPNPIYDMEIPLTAGDYVYVYGEMDGDGFYHGRLVNGTTGLVPSNFVERVSDGDAPPPRRSSHRRLSNLQDIEEVDEDSSESEEQVELTPPTDLEVQRQFVDGDSTSVALHWTVPLSPPPQLTGYSVYLNGVRRLTVDGPDQCTALVSDVTLTQLVRLTVRSRSNGGESADNAIAVVLNPQYPDPPYNILVSSLDSPTSLLVHFSPHPHTLTPVTRYTLYLNQHVCTHLEATESTTAQQTISILVLPRDVLQLEAELNSASSIKLTVTASNEGYESVPSLPVDVARELLDHLLSPEGYSTEKREHDLQLRQNTQMESSNGGHVTTDASHVTQEAGHVINGVADSPVQEEPHKVRYYRALYSYDPHQQSPNLEYADEELAFQEGDIITSVSGVDVDGFFDGSLGGRHGVVPSNMVEEILDPEALGDIEHTINNVVHSNGRPLTPPLDNGPRVLRAVADYDPALDSPNENSEVELTFSEGELITVYGLPDQDGFYQAELNGKKGLVPHNFVETPSSTDRELSDNRKTKLISSQDTGINVNLTHSD